ncbi:MAG: homoserine dehydrogenase [Elusimicrobiota bacterium]
MPVKIGLVGCGTVGMSVLKILHTNPGLIEDRVGDKIVVKTVCDKRVNELEDIKKYAKDAILTDDYKKIVSDPEISLVVELVGGYTIAKDVVMESLRAGKQVATANKALIATYWNEIFSTAKKYKALIYFEASVAAGVPVIQALNEGLAANRIESITGILNGTTNYILSAMSRDGKSFASALKEAQKAGFAEADPTLDIEGHDTKQKLSILSSLAYDNWVPPDKIYCEGITGIDVIDLKFAKEEFGLTLKLLGVTKFANGKLESWVRPTFIQETHMMSRIENEYNGILIKGDAAGDVMFYGRGAGGDAAASGVLSDIIYLARNVVHETAEKMPYVMYNERKLNFLPIEDSEGEYFLRFTTVDRPGVLAKISGALGENNVSIASCFQRAIGSTVPIFVTTHKTKEGNIRKAMACIDNLPIVRSKTVVYRIED